MPTEINPSVFFVVFWEYFAKIPKNSLKKQLNFPTLPSRIPYIPFGIDNAFGACYNPFRKEIERRFLFFWGGMKKLSFVVILVVILVTALTAIACNSQSFEEESFCEICGGVLEEKASESGETICSGHEDLGKTDGFQTSSDDSYEYGQINLYSGTKTKLYAVSYIPKQGKQVYPTVIMVHGLNATADGMAIMAKELVKHGYVCITFDFVNGSNLSKSGNKMKKMSLLTEKADLLAVIKQLQFIDYVDKNNVFLYGESQGGIVSLLAATEAYDKINGMILSYPALMIPDTIRATYPDEGAIPETVSLHGCALGKIYAEDAYDIYTWKLCEAYAKPVFIMHGNKDTSVDISVSEKAITHFKNARLEVVEGAGHGFGTTEYRVPTMQMLSDFVQNNLRK